MDRVAESPGGAGECANRRGCYWPWTISGGTTGRRAASGSTRLRLELGPVLVDQVQVVVLPGMEVAPVEVQVLPDQLAVDAVLAPQPGQPVAPDPPVPQQAVAFEHMGQAL